MEIMVVPANRASWEELAAVVGAARCHEGRCYCQRFKIGYRAWPSVTDAEREDLLREQTGCDDPAAETTTGLVARVDGEPAGWCAVEPRTAFPNLRTSRVLWPGRDEDKDDPDVWALTCLVVRREFRGRGLTYALTRAAVDFARERGARALEGYAMITQPGLTITWGELHVGSRNAFADAGFTEVTRPTKRRAVMRIEL